LPFLAGFQARYCARNRLTPATRENLDLIREGVAALNRRDTDGILATLHEDVRLEPLRAVLDGTVYRGHEGLKQWLADTSEDWEQQRVELLDVRALQSGQALVEAVLHVRYRGSGNEVAAPGAWLCEFRDGFVSRIRFYRDSDSALEAAGTE
jgi:ketosteroid isomerase-like protein